MSLLRHKANMMSAGFNASDAEQIAELIYRYRVSIVSSNFLPTCKISADLSGYQATSAMSTYGLQVQLNY